MGVGSLSCCCEAHLAEPASALSLARFLRLHGSPAGTDILWEQLGMTCFKLALPLDCIVSEG